MLPSRIAVLCLVGLSLVIGSLGQEDSSKCFSALRRYPKPDVTYTAKHLWDNCPELCRNSSGRFPTGQFPHPWDCNAFINCYNVRGKASAACDTFPNCCLSQDDAWVHWCQVGLVFNEKNMQCDWPRNVDCNGRSKPGQFTVPPDVTTTSQWELVTTPPSNLEIEDPEDVVTCKDLDSKLNDKEYLGIRPDLCKSGSGDYAAPDCRFYVRCVGSKAYVSRCPGGFVFDSAARQCDWPSKNPKCLKACLDKDNYVVPNSKTTPVPKPLQTTTLVTTVDPLLVNASCNESHCIPKAGCRKEICKQGRGMFEVPGNCKQFANCWDSCAYVNECPPGMAFDESQRLCDAPSKLPKSHKCYKDAEKVVAAQTGPAQSYGTNMVQLQGVPSGGSTQWQSMGTMQQAQW